MVFSFFRPSFDKLYAQAMASDDPQTILKHLKEALKAAGNDLDKSGVALFSIGDVLLQLGTATNQAQLSERGRTSTAQGLTMVKRERQQHLAPKAAAALGLPSTMPLDDLVAA